MFERYGTILKIWTSDTRPSYAFVRFESHIHALDAFQGTTGKILLGSAIRVEIAKGTSIDKNLMDYVNRQIDLSMQRTTSDDRLSDRGESN